MSLSLKDQTVNILYFLIKQFKPNLKMVFVKQEALGIHDIKSIY